MKTRECVHARRLQRHKCMKTQRNIGHAKCRSWDFIFSTTSRFLCVEGPLRKPPVATQINTGIMRSTLYKGRSSIPELYLFCRSGWGFQKALICKGNLPTPRLAGQGGREAKNCGHTSEYVHACVFAHKCAHISEYLFVCHANLWDLKIRLYVFNFERYLTSSLNDSNINEKRVIALYAKRWESDLRHRVSQICMTTQRTPLFLICPRTPIHI